MNSKFNLQAILPALLMALCLLPECLSVWIPYRQFVGYIPSYTYKVNLNAGDTIRGYLTWPVGEDLDIYLYRSGQDLLSSSTYVTR